MDILSFLNKQSLKLKTFQKGEVLFYEGDLCESIGVVKNGELKISSYLENGHEVIYNIIEKGQMFGNNLLFSSEPHYRGDVVSTKDSEIYIIDKETLLGYLKENTDFLIAYLNAQSDFGKQLNLNIKLLTLKTAEERILYYLSINKNKIAYKSVSELANKLYLTRESTSRELHRLAKLKIIEIQSKAIVKL